MTHTDGKTVDRAAIWNTRYQNKSAVAGQLSDELQTQLGQLPIGRSLDLACGDGAAALQLAAAGHQVVAVDFAKEGLKRLQVFAAEEGRVIDTHQLDLSVTGSLSALGCFDNIVILRYLPDLSLLQQLSALMEPSGRLFISSFNLEHHRQTGFSQRFCLKPRMLCDSFPQLKLIEYQNGAEQGRSMDSYLFQK